MVRDDDRYQDHGDGYGGHSSGLRSKENGEKWREKEK